jgi:hypothetical protein
MYTINDGSLANRQEQEDSPIASLWDLQLIWGKHSAHGHNIYAVRFISKLAGNYEKIYLESDLKLKSVEILHELNLIGVIERQDLQATLLYLKRLKINGIYEEVEDLEDLLTPTTDDALQYYDLLSDFIQNNQDLFSKITQNEYNPDLNFGIHLDSPLYLQKYFVEAGYTIFALPTDRLLDILNLVEARSNRVQEILQTWLSDNLLLKRTRGDRLQEPIRPWRDRPEFRRFYIIKIADVSGVEGSAGVEVLEGVEDSDADDQ